MIRLHALHRRSAGTNTLVVLRDTRWEDSQQIIETMEVDLSTRTQLVYTFPGIVLSIDDFYNHLEVSIQTNGYDTWQGGESNLLVTMAMIDRLSNTSYMGFQYSIDNIVDHLTTTGITAIPGERRTKHGKYHTELHLSKTEEKDDDLPYPKFKKIKQLAAQIINKHKEYAFPTATDAESSTSYQLPPDVIIGQIVYPPRRQNSQPTYKLDYQFGYPQGRGNAFNGGYNEYHNSQWNLPPTWMKSEACPTSRSRLMVRYFNDSSVYSISEGKCDVHQNISIMVQDTPFKEAAFMTVEGINESDDEQSIEEYYDDQNNALKIINQLKIEQIRLEEQKDEEIRKLKTQLQKEKEKEIEARYFNKEFPPLGNSQIARPFMEVEVHYSGNTTTTPKIRKITNQLYNVKVEFEISSCLMFGTTTTIDTGASACGINKKVIPEEALEPLTQSVFFNGLNSRQEATHRINQGSFLIEGNKFKIPLIYAFHMRDNNDNKMLIGANFLRSMKGGIRIEGDEMTIYKKVTRIKTSNQTKIAEIAALEVEPSRIHWRRTPEALKNNGELCKFDIINPDITIEDRPLKHVTPAMKDSFKIHVDSLLKIGAIRPSRSRHRTMAMIVNSKTTIDPATEREIKGKERMIFNTRFHQVAMDEEPISWTAFLVPGGLYEWLVMPFGLKNTPAAFQRKMDKCFKGTKSFIAIYIDDILVFLKNKKEHAKHLESNISLLSGGIPTVPLCLSEEYEDHLRRSHKDFQPLSRIFTKAIFTHEEPGALYRHFQLKANQTSIRMDEFNAWRTVAQDIEVSAVKEAVKAMRRLQAIIQCKAQICFGKSTKDSHWSDQREDVRVQNKEARRILIELEALAQRLGRNNI
nr:TPA: orf y [Tanacetum cinerariifolium]